MDINVSRSPRHLRVTQTMMEDFLCDPVLAAKVIMGYELDYFQAARLRYFWWVPKLIDKSGFSSGKTVTDWIYIQLRCLLIGDHHAGVYYPTFSTGQQTFWQYFHRCPGKIFRAQLGRTDEQGDEAGKDRVQGPSCWVAYYRNDSVVKMPAPSFIKDAASQASLRLNTLLIEEWTHIDAQSDGINKQLLGRNTRESFNKNHPLWCNHVKFTAPAKPSSHPSTARLKRFKKDVKAGNPYRAVISYNYKHYSDKPTGDGSTFAQKYRNDDTVAELKLNLEESEFMGEALGIESVSGAGWYNSAILDPCKELAARLGLDPVCSRAEDKEVDEWTFYFLGVDPAPALGQKTADGSLVALRVKPRSYNAEGKPALSNSPSDWRVDPIYARKVRGASVAYWSALLHRLHEAFGFARICVDQGAGGGGDYVRMDLKKVRQTMDEIDFNVTPIATPDDATVSAANHILIMFFRGDHSVKQKWPSLPGDCKLIEVVHVALQLAFSHQEIPLPVPYNERDLKSLEGWSEERKWALRCLSQMAEQLKGIVVQMDQNGVYVTNRHGSKQFSSAGKKDFASALGFAYAAFLIWLATNGSELENGGSGEDSGFSGRAC